MKRIFSLTFFRNFIEFSHFRMQNCNFFGTKRRNPDSRF